MAVLVDTSVWIDFLRGAESPQSRWLEHSILQREHLLINGLIEMELLGGCRAETEHARLRSFLKPFQYHPHIPSAYLELAADIYRSCRKKGKTIRKSVDCIIAANALIEGYDILHKDRDFLEIASVFPLNCL